MLVVYPLVCIHFYPHKKNPYNGVYIMIAAFIVILLTIGTYKYYDMSSKGYTTFLTCHVGLSTQYLDLRAGDMFCSAPLGTSIDDGFPIVQ